MQTTYQKYFQNILWTAEEIEAKNRELAAWINTTYQGSKHFIIIGLLKGCLPFLTDLLKHVTIMAKVEYMRFSSYGNDVQSSGDPRLLLDCCISIKDADVLVVDDIVDTGLTTAKVLRILEQKQPQTIRFMTLIDKKGGRVNGFKPDIYGFDAPNHFLIGYGLDVNDHFRQVPYIGVFNQKYLKEFQ